MAIKVKVSKLSTYFTPTVCAACGTQVNKIGLTSWFVVSDTKSTSSSTSTFLNIGFPLCSKCDAANQDKYVSWVWGILYLLAAFVIYVFVQSRVAVLTNQPVLLGALAGLSAVVAFFYLGYWLNGRAETRGMSKELRMRRPMVKNCIKLYGFKSKEDYFFTFKNEEVGGEFANLNGGKIV